jgi:hypothetical protein
MNTTSLGFWFCFEWPTTFCMLTTEMILSLFVMDAMTISRRLVSLGRKLCLFMYYVE